VASYHSCFAVSWQDAETVLTHHHAYIRNLAYSLQYLEYLANWLRRRGRAGNIHGSVLTHLQKTFIIFSMSVIESVLWYVIRRSGHQKTLGWKQIQELTSNPKLLGGDQIRSRVLLEKMIDPPGEVEMTLDQMSKKAESKRLLGVDTAVYAQLHHLRGLRNRVHIHSAQHDKDTDWWAISPDEVDKMKRTLHAVLTCDVFAASAGKVVLLDFLRTQAPQGV
jgi:hypothetical protein